MVDVSAYIAGPFGGRVLADLGAEVIKVEPLTGEAFRYTGNVFLALNHGKRGVAIDLKAAEGRALVRQLTTTADALPTKSLVTIPAEPEPGSRCPSAS